MVVLAHLQMLVVVAVEQVQWEEQQQVQLQAVLEVMVGQVLHLLLQALQ
jgi:hypothetical protein